MEFALSQEISHEIANKAQIVRKISDYLEASLHQYNYGSDVEKFIIGCICISEGFESFFKERRSRYVKVDKCLSYDIKLSYEIFATGNDRDIAIHVFDTIINSSQKLLNMRNVSFDHDKLFNHIRELKALYLESF